MFHFNKKMLVAILFLSSVGLLTLLFNRYTASAATTIGEGITTNGALAVTNNNAQFTLGASNSIRVDASSASVTSGVVDINITGSTTTANIVGQDLTMTLQNGAAGISSGYKTNIISPISGLQVGNVLIGDYILFTPNANDQSNSTFIASNATLKNVSGARSFFGYQVSAPDAAAGESAISMNGDLNAFEATLIKNGGSGQVKGASLTVKNLAGSTASNLFGVIVNADTSQELTSNGVGFLLNHTAGTLQDGVKVITSGVVTDALDASSDGIVNAINLGQNTVLASGSFSIDLNNSGADTLTVTNSNSGGSALASVAIEGGLTVGNNGSNPGTAILKHLSTTGSIDNTNLGANLCESFTVTLNGTAAGDSIVATPGADGATALSNKSIVWSAYGTANTINLRVCNPTGSALGADPSAVTWRFDVWQH